MLISITEAVPRAAQALADGKPVVLPLPTPLPYAIFGIGPGIVNGAKGRPADQPTGIVIADIAAVTPFLDVTPASLVEWLSVAEGLNLFVPLVADAPNWLIGHEGKVGLMGAWLPQLREILDTAGHLYVSSGNRTGATPAITAAEADAAFGELLVVDGDVHRDEKVVHGSSSIIEISSTGDLRLARSGVQDQAFGDGEAFLADLRTRWSQRRLSA